MSNSRAMRAEALQANRTYQILIASEIRKFTGLYHYNLEKQRVLGDVLKKSTLSRTLDFGVSLPPEEIDRCSRSSNNKRISRTTTSVRKRIRLFKDQLLVDSSGEEPLPNSDTLYISDTLQGIPRTHIQEKFSPIEKSCLRKALQLRVQMKLTQQACDFFSEKKAAGVDASDSYCEEYKRIQNIDEKTTRGLLEDADWPFIAHLLFCQTEPDRIKIVGARPKRSALECQIYWEGIETANTGEWSDHELNRLKQIVRNNKGFHWRKIAHELGTNRAPLECFRQWQTRFNRHLRKSTLWTQEEDDRMISLIKHTCGDADFLGVSANMEGRNHMQCWMRWRNTLRPGIKMRTPFRPIEDICLYLAVTSRGFNWKQLTPHLDDVSGRGRTDVNARERFVNFMDPKLFFDNFTKSEERVVEQLMVKYFADRIKPSRGIKKKNTSLLPQEWKFVASKFRKLKTKRSTYQVKRTWYLMRRKERSQKRNELVRARKTALRGKPGVIVKNHGSKIVVPQGSTGNNTFQIRDSNMNVRKVSPWSSLGEEHNLKRKKLESLPKMHVKRPRL